MQPPSQTIRIPAPIRSEELTLEDLEAVRLLLRGGSVVDWHRLDFRDHNDVDRFLRVNEFEPTSEDDMDRLEVLRDEAVEYLSRNFNFNVPIEVATNIPARDVFFIASKAGKHQTWACIILKVMHIIHHLAGRELSTRLNISTDKIYHETELKAMQVIEELRAAGYTVDEFQWSRKTPDSLVTKLLAKRSTLAANIYDKLRFRMIVRKQEDLLPLLVAMHRRLIPFNYVVPGESVNHLLDFRSVVASSVALKRYENLLQEDQVLEKRQERAAKAAINEFSGSGYRIINFVADLPIRIDSHLDANSQGYGNVVFVLTEFQLVDKATAEQNEQGENNHEAYKERQHRVVRMRLMRGRRRSNTEKVRHIRETDPPV